MCKSAKLQRCILHGNENLDLESLFCSHLYDKQYYALRMSKEHSKKKLWTQLKCFSLFFFFTISKQIIKLFGQSDENNKSRNEHFIKSCSPRFESKQKISQIF